jgi:hypothetical protein
MKNMIKLPVIVLGLMLLLTGTTQKVFAQDEDISLQTFYDELSPYGTWIQDPQYGYVWRPDVDQGDFRPYYSNGHWVMTEYGNTWVSDYDWGWAPFHYGRWVTDRYNQWLWIPDTTWGPAWVNWRSGGGNYGWAPLGPSINVGFNIPSFWWVFIPQTNIYINRFPRYRSYGNHRYLANTVIINNVYVHNRNTYYTGPRRDEIRRVINRDVTVYNINRTDRPGRSRISNNTVNIYNPRPVRGSDNRNSAPRNVVQRDAMARNGRPYENRSNQGRDNNVRMNSPERRDDNNVRSVDRPNGNDRPSVNRPSVRGNENRTPANRPGADRGTFDRTTRERSGDDQQRAQAMQAQRQQRDAQRSQELNQQRDQQQRQQRDAQQSQQRDQQQRQQRDAQQSQQREAQQREQQRNAQSQQREQQQRQQRDAQQSQQREQMSRPPRTERVEATQRPNENRSMGNSGSSRSGATRESRGGGRG